MEGLTSIGVTTGQGEPRAVYDVNPFQPNQLIASSKEAGIFTSFDFGEHWTPIASLNALLATAGFGLVGLDRNSLATCVRFNPYASNQILVDTAEAGLFFSGNGGESWTALPGSTKIPNVFAISWAEADRAYVGSYGRGVWELRLRNF